MVEALPLACEDAVDGLERDDLPHVGQRCLDGLGFRLLFTAEADDVVARLVVEVTPVLTPSSHGGDETGGLR